MKKYLVIFAIFFTSIILPQQKQKAVFVQPQPSFYDEIEKEAAAFSIEKKETNKQLKVDFTGINLPKSKSEFKSYWHNDPVNQGITGTCWSFSTTSYFESEIYRIQNKKIKLSEMYTAYWEYVEKAKGFVKSKGKTYFGEGSEANALFRIWKTYGVVPLEAYSGKLPNQKVFDHSKMYDEMSAYLKSVKERNAWNEKDVVETIREILNGYMGEVPETFTYEGKKYTPKEFFTDVVKINFDDYHDFLSIMQSPYFQNAEYTVPDNWWHSKDYYNIPLDDFMSVIKKAVRNGYTLCIGGDVSEPGIDSRVKAAVVPTFDIPSEYIDENARQFRFTNKTTEDDHGIHLVGYVEKDGKDWYLIKDSGSGAFNTGDKGYYFYSEDFVKLKMLGIVVHKDALGDFAKKIK